MSVLEERGAQGLRQEQATFEELLGPDWAGASLEAAWGAIQPWLVRAYDTVAASPDLSAGLLMFRHAYAALFWLGLLREKLRQKAVHKVENPVDYDFPRPEWAESFVGQRFDCTAAVDAGWIDQSSPLAHFGIQAGPNVWLYKLDHGNDCHPCGRVWWRFIVVILDEDQLIRTVRSEVHEVYSEGRSVLIGYDFLPWDVEMAVEAIECALQSYSVTG